ncbi:PPC domain-containing DNA-binding protein [Acidovorax sp. JHL-9]|uniref:PPC domain-containing DNA-binding protein n=1 Tax=Acidovorax sp. JHL-9 TaxID=1276756 RepID=UPI0009DB8989|nr:DUF296 domain-containing protein [Acidovorax sp. JHL-9]
MNERYPSSYARARTLIHPGPFNPVRIQTKRADRARHFRLLLAPGQNLFEALVRPLAALGVESASTTILGGMFERLEYCTAPPDPSRQAIIRYTRPIESGRTWMVFGNATIGKNSTGEPLVHCHAAVRTQSGELKGGHIITQTSVVGPTPISVLVTSLDGFQLRVAFDPETNIPLIQPLDPAGKESFHE